MQLRRVLLATTALLATLLAPAANAATVTATVGGASTIAVFPGDTFTVDLTLTREVELSGYSFSLRWDGGATPLFEVVGTTENLPPGFPLERRRGSQHGHR